MPWTPIGRPSAKTPRCSRHEAGSHARAVSSW
jgi:hypothetical protein